MYTDGKGTCSNKRSDKYNHEVYENGWCWKYQKWGVLQSALTMEEHKREAQRLENDQGKYINGKNACFNSYATYGSSSHVFTQYQMVNYSKTSNSLSYGGTYYHYDNWNSTYNDYLSEWVERGFKACDLINILINQYCKSAFGSLF